MNFLQIWCFCSINYEPVLPFELHEAGLKDKKGMTFVMPRMIETVAGQCVENCLVATNCDVTPLGKR